MCERSTKKHSGSKKYNPLHFNAQVYFYTKQERNKTQLMFAVQFVVLCVSLDDGRYNDPPV